MTDDKTLNEAKALTEIDFQKKMAVDLFNFVWTLLDRAERTQEEDDTMTHAAHASRFHWGEVGTQLNLTRGEWQISRVYSVLKRPEAALYHAQRCLEICRQNGIGDFDLAFAHEAVARAYAVDGDSANCQQALHLAQAAGQSIEQADDRDYFFDELSTIPC